MTFISPRIWARLAQVNRQLVSCIPWITERATDFLRGDLAPIERKKVGVLS